MANQQQPTWENIAPYVASKRQAYDVGEERAEQIVSFLKRRLNTEHVEYWLRGTHGPGSEYASCSRFFVHYDCNWHPVEDRSEACEHGIVVAVSERGPFVTCYGVSYSLEPHPIAKDRMWKVGKECAIANERARDIAMKVADAFDLIYVDANYLRQFRLDPKELPWDDVLQSLDIDCDEPTALNILFCEDL